MAKGSNDKLKGLAKGITEAAGKARDTAEPYVKKAMDTAEPYVKKARDTAEPYLEKAFDVARPYIDKAKDTAARATASQEIYIQYGDHELRTGDIAERCREDYVAQGGKPGDLHDLQIYVKPEDNAAYYVVNSSQTGKIVF